MLKRQKIMIIDGYNVLRNNKRYADFVGEAPNFEDWTSEIWNSAREALLKDVLTLVDSNNQAIIVYDASSRENRFNDVDLPSQKLKYIQVIFSEPGESADTRIQKLVRKAREKSYDVSVVTSDLQIQNSTMGTGVVRTSVREFSQTISEEEHSQFKKDSFKNSIENIIDKNTYEKLKQLRDSF